MKKESVKNYDWFVIGSNSYGRGATFTEAFFRMLNARDKRIEPSGMPLVFLVPRDYDGEISWDYSEAWGFKDGECLKFPRMSFRLPSGFTV